MSNPDTSTPLLARGLRSASHLADRYSYGFAKVRWQLRQKDPLITNPVLVYTAGKVGSTSVAAALGDALSPRPVAHVHYLARENLQTSEGLFRARARTYRGTAKMRRFLPHVLWVGDRVRQAIDCAPEGTVWDVVTLVRDPVLRNVSAFFQTLELFQDIWPEEELKGRGPDEIAHDLVRRFVGSYVESGCNPMGDGDLTTWFEEELQRVFGVDVYASEFPTSRGYCTYSSSRARVLLLRLEDVPTVASQALGEFFGIPGPDIRTMNDGSTKNYRDIYAQFRSQLRLPEDYLDRLYLSRYCRHFYTESERERMRRRWVH